MFGLIVQFVQLPGASLANFFFNGTANTERLNRIDWAGPAMVYKQAKSKYWWYKFTWKGSLIRETTKQTNKRTAEQMEAAHRTALAKGEVGIRDRKISPTLRMFLRSSFLPFYETTKREEPNTLRFYKCRVERLLQDPILSGLELDVVSTQTVADYVARLRENEPEIAVATINRDLATLRPALRLANGWGDLVSKPPKISLLDGEVCRERVLGPEEESAYLSEASPLLRTFATIILDCGLRPDEVYRLRWNENYRDGRVFIHTGKSKAARRSVPVTPRVTALLEMWRMECPRGWMFPASTKSGHMTESSIKKPHWKAVEASGVARFVPYDLRHTCLTRWAKYLDPFTLKRLAGHESLETTMKYIHLNEADSETRLRDARVKIESERQEADQGGHTFGHTQENEQGSPVVGVPKFNAAADFWRARRGSNSRPDDSKSSALSN